MLLDWLGNIKRKPRRVFANHGEDKVCDIFANEIEERLGIEALAPYNGASYDLLTGECLDEGNKTPIEKRSAAKDDGGSPLFRALLAAGERLLAVIKKNKGLANKQLQKFKNEIDALSERWDIED